MILPDARSVATHSLQADSWCEVAARYCTLLAASACVRGADPAGGQYAHLAVNGALAGLHPSMVLQGMTAGCHPDQLRTSAAVLPQVMAGA